MHTSRARISVLIWGFGRRESVSSSFRCKQGLARAAQRADSGKTAYILSFLVLRMGTQDSTEFLFKWGSSVPGARPRDAVPAPQIELVKHGMNDTINPAAVNAMDAAYRTLTDYFNTHRTAPTQISILPSAPSPSPPPPPPPPQSQSQLPPQILVCPPHLGIPKQSLIRAFVTARSLFVGPNTTPQPCLPWPDGEGLAGQLEATRILLLVASEHLTAVNTRKRLLCAGLHSPAEELVWLESLLTSPLPRHNKSPLLWAHRRWVVSNFFSPSLALQQQGVTVDGELGVVRRSAEVHARNYYAWGYARWIVCCHYGNSCSGGGGGGGDNGDGGDFGAGGGGGGRGGEEGGGGEGEEGEGEEEEEEGGGGGRGGAGSQLQGLVDAHLRFCWRHAADVGVWAFLGFLLEQGDGPVDGLAVERTVAEVVAFCDIAPGHESVWCTVRTLVGRTAMAPEVRLRLVAMLQRRAQEAEAGGGGGDERVREKMLRRRALRWIHRFGIAPEFPE